MITNDQKTNSSFFICCTHNGRNKFISAPPGHRSWHAPFPRLYQAWLFEMHDVFSASRTSTNEDHLAKDRGAIIGIRSVAWLIMYSSRRVYTDLFLAVNTVKVCSIEPKIKTHVAFLSLLSRVTSLQCAAFSGWKAADGEGHRPSCIRPSGFHRLPLPRTWFTTHTSK